MEPSKDASMNDIPSSEKDLRTSQSPEESARDSFLVRFDTGDPTNPHVCSLYLKPTFLSFLTNRNIELVESQKMVLDPGQWPVSP